MSESAVHRTRRQVIDFLLVRHGLVERLGPDGAQAAAVVGDVAPEALDELVLVPGIRGAPLAVAERDLGVFTAGLEPPDEEAAKAVVGNAWRSLDGIGALEALDRMSEAVYESLRDAGRDRDLLVPDPALRKRIWTGIGGPGTVLVAGEVAGLWRPAKKGRKLLITVEPLGKLTSAATDELAGEIERLAPFRRADSGDLRLAAL